MTQWLELNLYEGKKIYELKFVWRANILKEKALFQMQNFNLSTE